MRYSLLQFFLLLPILLSTTSLSFSFSFIPPHQQMISRTLSSSSSSYRRHAIRSASSSLSISFSSSSTPPTNAYSSLFSSLPLNTTRIGPHAARTITTMGSQVTSSLHSLQPAPITSSSSISEEDDENQEQADLPTNLNSPTLLRIRHTSAHVLAMAVQQLYPTAQVTIGPWIDNGFYYDFNFPPNPDDGTKFQLSPDKDFVKIKKAMDKIIQKNYPIIREEVTREEAHRRISLQNEPFKMELLDSIKTEPITIYHIGDKWWDLCAGPHLESTGLIPKNAVKLQSVAGAYWRGDEKRESLQRIYATAWNTQEELKRYLFNVEEAKKRDHRLLGKRLDLFSIQEDAGGGLVFWHPKGSTIRTNIEDFWRKQHSQNGYDVIYTPHIANVNLWETSGHMDFYKEGMFDQMKVENEEYQIKPMNCPFHCLMFRDQLRSYRDLPIRWAELGTVYRYEKSGSLHGLMRVRGFTQDDAHIFCRPEQLEDEIVGVLELTQKILKKFGFEKYEIMLSTRPEKSVGSDIIWDLATNALEGALKRKGWDYTINEGDGAFYGPKIDLKIKDALGRTWQCSTVQADFNLPERFNLEYSDKDGSKQRPIMVHRAIFGSIERFFGVLIEHCKGDFPLWLAPVQMRLLPVTDDHQDFCHEVKREAAKRGIRVEVDRGHERLPKQMRNAQVERIPIIAVVGDREVETGELAVRSRKLGDMGSFKIGEIIEHLYKAIEEGEEMKVVGRKEVVEEAEVVKEQTTVIDSAEANNI